MFQTFCNISIRLFGIQSKTNKHHILNVNQTVSARLWLSVSRVACQLSDIIGCNFDVYLLGKCLGNSSVPLMALLSKENNPTAHWYADNCGIRRRSALYLITRGTQRGSGPFRTHRGRFRQTERDGLLSSNRDESALQTLSNYIKKKQCTDQTTCIRNIHAFPLHV